MISKESIRITITLSKALYLACRKHHLRISKIAREATEDALREKLERLNIKTISYMSKRAEKVALKAYPDRIVNDVALVFSEQRRIFQEGYEQAEKDLALTLEDVAYIVDTFYAVEGNTKEKCEEVLRRFNGKQWIE